MAIVKKPPYFEDVVNDGEQRLMDFLKENLPNTFTIIPNIELANKNPRNGQIQFYEYDIIVVAPHAVYNIENKDYRGRLEGDDNYWYHNDRRMPNPLKLGRLKTAILASKLKEKHIHAWVYNVVTLSHPYQTMDGIDGTAQELTFLLNERLIDFIKSPPDHKTMANEIIEKQKSIVSIIIGDDTKRKPEAKKEVVGYDIVEILDQEKNYTEYLVKAKGVTSSIKKRVKEYALNISGFSTEELAKYEAKVKNQHLALSKMRGNPFVVSTEFRSDDENGYFYEITDFLDENSLEAEMNRRTFTFDEKISIIKNLISALKAAHEVSIFHRDINPDNIFYYQGFARLGNFGKAYFTDETRQNYTVMQTLTEENVTPYLAHELLGGDVSQESDIYSLTMLMYKLFTGVTPVKSPYELDKIGGLLPKDRLPSTKNAMVPGWLDDLCERNITVDPELRMQPLQEFERFIDEHLRKQVDETKTPKEQNNDETNAQPLFAVDEGSKIGTYIVHQKIGDGGFSQVFKVRHTLQGEDYALKLFNESVNINNVKSEYNALRYLDHPNVVKFKWNDVSVETGQFFTVMEFIDGSPLSEYDARTDKKLPHYRIYQVALNIVDALCYLQRQTIPLIHRDIKPDNILWDKKNERYVLIDFNVSETIDMSQDFVGTRPYIAPDLITDTQSIKWDNSSDLFALGVTLYQLICKCFPWKNKVPSQSVLPKNPQEIVPELTDEFAAFLLKSIGTSSETRFKNAEEMKTALEAIGVDGILKQKTEKTTEDIGSTEQYVSYLNTLFSQSRYGNAGTRSQKQSSAFDNATYIQTKLDEKLIPAIRHGKFKLLIITGNAGDGKTAFIKHIEKRSDNGIKHFDHGNGASFKLNGIPYISNYDGSQDEEDRDNNAVLKDFFAPFENIDNYNTAKEGRIIAINEGRLVEFLKTNEAHTHLGDIIENYFNAEGHYKLPDGLMIINLNLRSVVVKEDGSDSLLRKQIKALIEPTLWQGCDECSHCKECFIRYNVRSFADAASGNEIITRLEWLLRMVSLKRELHITMRDLRSLLSFIITRDHNCSDVVGFLQGDVKLDSYEYWKYLYFNFSDSQLKDSGNKDRLIKQIREADIGLVAVPGKDRDLYFAEHSSKEYLEFPDRNDQLLKQFNNSKQYIPHYDQNDDYRKKMKQNHRLFIRHQYFEGLADFKQRFPYHSLAKFHKCIIDNDEAELIKIKKNIARAISLNEGCDNDTLSERFLALASTRVNDPMGKTYRLFSLDDFDLKIQDTHSLTEYFEYEPDSLQFIHKGNGKNSKPIELPISLELYDMLHFIGQGYTPSLNDINGRFIELQIFKNQLSNLTYDRVMITRDNIDFYEIAKEGSKLTLQKMEVV